LPPCATGSPNVLQQLSLPCLPHFQRHPFISTFYLFNYKNEQKYELFTFFAVTDLKGKERSGAEDDSDDDGKERSGRGTGGPELIVRTHTLSLLADIGSTDSEARNTGRRSRKAEVGKDRVTRGDAGGGAKDRAWRSRVKALTAEERRSVQRADSDLRHQMLRNPSFARSRYVLTNTGAWARVVPPPSPGRGGGLQRKRTRDGIPRQRSAERDACPPGLFLIRYLNPCAANLLAGDMRLVR
jgi:hypothetical protein